MTTSQAAPRCGGFLAAAYLRPHHPARRVPAVSGAAADEQGHLALVWRVSGGVDHLHAVLPNGCCLAAICTPICCSVGCRRGIRLPCIWCSVPLPWPCCRSSPAPGDKPVDSSYPTARILLLLLTTVGLPYFALSATSPLVQAWFGSRCPGRSPYRLYALSNFGSLAALVSYPLLFEPAFDLSRQSALWSGAFLLYAALYAVSLACMWKLRDRSWLATDPPGVAEGPSGANGSTDAPTWWDRATWLLLPACASLMLLATTNHVCQDVAVVPLLWVIPLALYLLSFIICFDHARWYVRPVWAGAAVVALLGAAANDLLHSETPLSLVQELLLYFAMLFFVCMVCHGELVRRQTQSSLSDRVLSAHRRRRRVGRPVGGRGGAVGVFLLPGMAHRHGDRRRAGPRPAESGQAAGTKAVGLLPRLGARRCGGPVRPGQLEMVPLAVRHRPDDRAGPQFFRRYLGPGVLPR